MIPLPHFLFSYWWTSNSGSLEGLPELLENLRPILLLMSTTLFLIKYILKKRKISIKVPLPMLKI